MNKLLLLAFFLFSIGIQAQTYLMGNGINSYTTCSGTFFDSGGALGTYQNNENGTVTFFPSTPNSVLQITFTSFLTEDDYDGLSIYNGPSVSSPLISSGLLAGGNTTTCPAGSWRGNGSPGTITSTDVTGAITFKFTSGVSFTLGGWVATISCLPVSSSYIITNGTATTCSGNFYDSGGPTGDYLNSETYTYTIFPSTPGAKVQVNFTSFSTENGYDGLMIYNGSSVSSPLISSGLPVGNAPTSCPAGSWRGTGSPGIITSTDASGALTFVFRSGGIIASTGWTTSISCIASGNNFLMNNTAGSYTTCSGNFYDSGGLTSTYSALENSILTFYPATPNSNISFNFSSFDTEAGYDTLFVHNGISVSSPLIGIFSGVLGAGSISANNPQGALTFRFKSDDSFENAGWAATISCVSITAVPEINFVANFVNIPVGGSVNFTDLSTNNPISWNWTFTGAVNTNSTLQNPTNIQYNTPGCYPVTLTATNLIGGNTETATCYINVAPAGTYYCLPNPTNGTSANDYINGVTLNTISNLNTGAENGPVYTFYNTFTTNLNTGQLYPLGVQSGGWANDVFAAWIDYNSDGDFDDAGEKLGEFSSSAAFTFYTINFTVPTGTTSGLKVMRVRVTWSVTNMSPCTDYSYGETEDYIVNIVVPNTAPVANFVSDVQNINISQSVNFFDFSTNNPTNWTWTFTGAATTTSNLQNPTNITYNVAGCYPVTLVSGNAFGNNSITQTCYINVTNPTAFCTTLHQNDCSISDNISSFSITGTTLQNLNSGCTAANGLGYTNYGPNSNYTASLTRGQSYQFNLTSTSNSIASIWIDYNHNNLFDTNEWTQISTSTLPYLASTVSIVIPTNALLGATGIRIRTRDVGSVNAALDACTFFGSGETEDYTITIIAGGTGPIASFTPSSSSICAASCLTFNNTTTGAGGGATISWQFPGGTPSSSSASNPGTVCYPLQGTYTVSLTVTNANGSSTATQQIVVNPSTSVTITPGGSTSICAGSSINLNAIANSPNTTFSWSPSIGLNNSNISNPVASPTQTTTYVVTATANGCSATANVIVNVNPAPTTNAGQDVSICAGGSTNLIATSSSPLSTFSWTPSTGLSNATIANPTASPSSTTTYVVTVTSNGCTATDNVVVTVNNVTANAGQDVSICPGGSTQLNATGGGTYSWSPSTGLSNATVANPTASPSSTTTYLVTVTNNGCTATDNIVVSVGSISANAGQDVSICAGGSTNLTSTGGSTYLWSPNTGLNNPNIASPIANPTSTTTYTVTVSNGACSATDQVVVTVNPLPTANAGQNVSICAGSSTNLLASSNAANATYSWTPSLGLSNANIANPIANPTQTTTYGVTVSSNGCSATAFVTVTVNSVTASAGQNVSICAGASTQLSASGGLSYLWSPSAGLSNANIANPVANPSSSTTYVVTVTNNGCTANASQSVTVNTVNANAGQNQTICSGVSTQLNASGGTIYLWSPSAGLSNANIANPTANPISTTTYTVLVTSNGCTGTSQVIINVNSVTASAGQNVSICAGASSQLLASGGTSYAWTPAAGLSNNLIANPIATPSSTTTYTVQVTNGNCSSTAQVTVTVINLAVNAGNDDVVCPGQSAQLNATSSSGVSYSWSPSSGLNNANIANPVATPTQNTTYTVTVSQNGCTSSDQLVVNVNNFTANAGLDVTVCPTNSVQLNATGGTSYQWTPSTGLSNANIANPLASPSVTTAYTVVVTNGNCTQSDVVIITVGNVVALAGDDINLCSGQTSQLLASGGSSYSWSPATGLSNANIANPIVSVAQTTTYTVTVSSGTCISTDQVVVTVIPGVSANAGQDATICAGGSVTLNGLGGTTFSWSPTTGLSNASIANPIASPSQSTTYILTTSNGNCIDTDTVTVSITTINANAGIDLSICAGQSVPLNANGGTNYSWSPAAGLNNANISNPIANPTATTTYTVTVSTGNCTATDNLTITVNSVLVNAGFDLSICEGGSVQLQATSAGNTNYTWTPTTGLSNPFISNPIAAPTSTTVYIVNATDGLCSSTDEVLVTVNALPVSPVISQNGSDLFCGTAATSYQWYLNGDVINGAVNQTYTPSTNGSYAVEVVNINGCSALSAPFNFISVSVSEVSSNTLNIYPNPNTGAFRVTGSFASKGNITIDIVNILGEKIAVVYQGSANSSLNEDVDISNYASGVYIVRVLTNEGLTLKKIVKN